MTEYPAQPWRLAGEACVSVWIIPRSALPNLSDAVTPLTAGGRAVVVTAWIDYTPPGQLRYHELLATVAVRHGLAPAGSITEIWVDSATSLAGGRALWNIPKEAANLEFDHSVGFTGAASTDTDWIATAAFTPRGPAAPRTGARFSIVQPAEGQPKVTPVRAWARFRSAASTWTVNPDGPLGYLAGRRPLASAHVSDARLLFGTAER
ncbi:acetoacetate decarboxylase [Saccharomonospora piscinae]|uniref:acetoacetate decarboxylase family protein n=1 Tax=Saccharomonospora piscinae TaxID=687388 RepID=UPI001105D095|nr:acetoacetate decarboxylase family protein [Saccharomonospora piscinae]TLW94862.1 acetoacetate decarboxylase [Saccharomonospora piscinae]